MIIDIIAILLIAFGFYLGFSKGLVKTVFSILALLIAIVAALKLSPIVIVFLQKILPGNPAISFVIGFVLTFVLVWIVVSFIGNRIDRLFNNLQIGGVNKILGGAILAVIYAVFLSYGIYFMDQIDLISQKQKQESITYPILKPLPKATKKVGEKLKPVFKGFWDSLMDTMDAIKEKTEEKEDNN